MKKTTETTAEKRLREKCAAANVELCRLRRLLREQEQGVREISELVDVLMVGLCQTYGTDGVARLPIVSREEAQRYRLRAARRGEDYLVTMCERSGG